MSKTIECSACKAIKYETEFHYKNKTINYRSSKCKDCTREYDKEYRDKNKTKLAQQKKEYSATHKDKLKQKNNEHYKNNKDQYKKSYERTRAKELDYGIYRITIRGTNKVYIGEAKRTAQRRRTHFSDLKRGVHHCSGLQESYNKFGPAILNFEVLDILGCDATKLQLLKKEIYWIEKSIEDGHIILNESIK